MYPLLCMERRADGSKAFRTKRAEEKAARASDIKRQKIIEGICERERKEFEKEVQQEGEGARGTGSPCMLQASILLHVSTRCLLP